MNANTTTPGNPDPAEKSVPAGLATEDVWKVLCAYGKGLPNYEWLLAKPTISVAEAGQVLGISRGGAYEAARNGQIPTIKIGGRFLVPTAKLRAMLGMAEPIS